MTPNDTISFDRTTLVEHTADIVAAFARNNALPAEDLPGLIASVHGALAGLGQPKAKTAPTFVPAVPVKKSVTPDHLISLIDGKPYRTLKRHLTGHGLTPEGYRERYGLPADYPMVAANYSAARTELAKASGLGHQRRKRAA